MERTDTLLESADKSDVMFYSSMREETKCVVDGGDNQDGIRKVPEARTRHRSNPRFEEKVLRVEALYLK